MKPVHTVLALSAIAAIGAAAGVLFAPRKGRETRDNIKDFLRSHYPGIKSRRLEALADQIAREVKAEI